MPSIRLRDKRFIKPTLAILIVSGMGLAIRHFSRPSGELPAEVVKAEREVMGTLWSIQAVAETTAAVAQSRTAIEAAFRELHRIDALMSDWKKDTPLSSINAAAGQGPVEVPAELAAIISRGIGFGTLTKGAFDITWKGIEGLWHFDESFETPTQEMVAEARRLVDYRRIIVDGRRIGLPKGFAIGLGGIAKGYAIDRAGKVLADSGLRDFLINGGGDILASGGRGSRPWSIGIRDPRGAPNELLARVRLSDRSVVTSGDYERFRIVDGIRYHHIIDPRTGYPADKCRSVTVIAKTAEEADVLATAVFVLGREEGFTLLKRFPEAEAFMVDTEGRFWMTDGFGELAEFYATPSP